MFLVCESEGKECGGMLLEALGPAWAVAGVLPGNRCGRGDGGRVSSCPSLLAFPLPWEPFLPLSFIFIRKSAIQTERDKEGRSFIH